MSGGGFDDGHIASRAWTKKKEVPVVENTPASTSQRLGVSAHLKPKKGGKIILNDELSMTRQAHRGQEQPKSSVATLLGKGGDDAEGDLSESYDKLSSSRFSLNKQGDVRFPGHGKYSATAGLEDGLEQNLSAQSVPLSASGSSKPQSSNAKHNISSAKTGLRSTTAHETSVLTGTSTEGKGGVGNKRNFSGHLTPNESKSQLRQGDKDSHNSLEQSQASKPSNGSQLAGLSLLRQ